MSPESKPFNDKKRRRLLLPVKTASPNILSSARYDYQEWKNGMHSGELNQQLAQTSRPPAHHHAPVRMDASIDTETVSIPITSNGIETNKPSVIKSNPNVKERRSDGENNGEKKLNGHSRMIYDQQTQTNTTMLAENLAMEIMYKQDSIAEHIQELSEQNYSARWQMNTLQHEVYDLRSNLAHIQSVLYKLCDHMQVPNYTDDSGHYQTQRDVNVDEMPPPSPQSTSNPPPPPRILNLTNQLNSTSTTTHTLNYSSMSIEPMIEASNDSIQSYSNQSYTSPSGTTSASGTYQTVYQLDTSNNASDVSLHETSRQSTSSVVALQQCKQTASRTSNGSIGGSGSGSGGKLKTEQQNGEKHPDDEGNPNDEVIIGPNQTTVLRSILMNTNWTSHTSATRRLLRAKFSRETLATHSLTGKPSPAFMETSKPTKNRLNPKIIGDIVSYVAKRCKVTETAVRSSITTKCADENKMMRQRQEKARKRMENIPAGQNGHNKQENFDNFENEENQENNENHENQQQQQRTLMTTTTAGINQIQSAQQIKLEIGNGQMPAQKAILKQSNKQNELRRSFKKNDMNYFVFSPITAN